MDPLLAAKSLLTNHDGRRDRRLRNYRYRLLRFTTDSIEYQDDEGIRHALDTRDTAVSRRIYVERGWETDYRNRIMELAGPIEGTTFLDIGANIGMTTAAAIKLHGAADAIAFEPSPHSAGLMRRSMALNGIEDCVALHEVALSDESGIGHLGLSEVNPGDHRLGTDDRETIEVPLARLDDFNIDYDRVRLAWLDVQGHEAHVLAGATGLLASKASIAVEYAPAMLRAVDGADLLHDLVAEHFDRVADIRAGTEISAADVAQLEARYPGEWQTDLVLLR